jgi:hypothetical protein
MPLAANLVLYLFLDTLNNPKFDTCLRVQKILQRQSDTGAEDSK